MKRKSKKKFKALKSRLENYYHLVELNHRDGFSYEAFQRENKPISQRVNVGNISLDHLLKCMKEEERIRRRVHARNRIDNEVPADIRKAYKRFDRDARAREMEENKRANESLANTYGLFDRDVFSQEMISLGIEVSYIGFDSWASVREIEDHRWMVRMKYMREMAEGKLKDYSAEVGKD